MLFFSLWTRSQRDAAQHNECSPYSLSVSRVSQCVIASSAKVFDSQCLGPSGQCLVHTNPQLFLPHLTAKSFLLISGMVLPRHALKFHQTSYRLHFRVHSAPQCPRATWKQSKESCPSHMAGKQDLKTTMQDFWMSSQLGIVETLSVLLPAPELGHSHRLLLHLLFEIGALQWASGNLLICAQTQTFWL